MNQLPWWRINKWWLAGVVLLVAAGLRLIQLDRLPPALYWDELSLGYDAYAIAQTGRDHHGDWFPVVAFTSYGDYKPGGYIYAIVPFIYFFGLNEWAVRLPSALAGLAIVVGIGWLSYQLNRQLWPAQPPSAHRLAFLVGLVVATFSSWLIIFARAGWEVNLATAFLLWSVLLFLHARLYRCRWPWQLAAVGLAAAAMYTYHATRLITPLLLLALFLIQFWQELLASHGRWVSFWRAGQPLLLPGLFFILLISPILLSLSQPQLQQRFAETSILATGSYVQQSNQLRQLAGDSWLTRLFTHRYLMLGQEIANGYAAHFNFNYLFFTGDQNPRHGTGRTGIMLLTDLPWLIWGSLLIVTVGWRVQQSRWVVLLLGWWLLIGILPAALTTVTPHALRTLPTAPVWLVVISLGASQAIWWLHQRRDWWRYSGGVLLGTILLLHVFGWLQFWRYYTTIYPQRTAREWQYGYRQLVAVIAQLEATDPQQRFFITREFGRPAMYYWFYRQTPPRAVQAVAATTPQDQGEFLRFENIEFINTVNEAKPGIVASSVKGAAQLQQMFPQVETVTVITDLQQQPVWVVSRVSPVAPRPQ